MSALTMTIPAITWPNLTTWLKGGDPGIGTPNAGRMTVNEPGIGTPGARGTAKNEPGIGGYTPVATEQDIYGTADKKSRTKKH